MENKILEFTVNGAVQRIEAKMSSEAFEQDGICTRISSSGGKVITDGYNSDGKWSHKKTYDKEGILESEVTRVYDEGKLISHCEDRADGEKFTSAYEYDDRNNIVYQKQECLKVDGSAEVMIERWFKNFYDKNEFDDSIKSFEKNICYRAINDKNQVVRFIDSECEVNNEYDEQDKLSCMTTFRGGNLFSKTSYYHSDDGLITVCKSENYDDRFVHYEIKDCRESAENPDRKYVIYRATEKF